MNDVESLRLALEAEKHCHRGDNAYLLARAEEAEAAARDFANTLALINDIRHFALAEGVLAKHPGWCVGGNTVDEK